MPLPLQGSRGEGAPGDAFPPAASIVGNARFSLVPQLLTSAFTAEPTLFLARRLGADHYGIFASLSG